MRLVIRYGAAADAAALAELAARTFSDTFAADNPPEDIARHMAKSYGTAQQLRELADDDITTLLAEVDGRLAGYAQVRRGATPECVRGEAPLEVWRFYVDRPWHGRGVAQALMQRVVAEAQQRGARTLWLGVWERNERARAFYIKHGFIDAGTHIFMLGTDVQTDRVMVRAVAVTTGATR